MTQDRHSYHRLKISMLDIPFSHSTSSIITRRTFLAGSLLMPAAIPSAAAQPIADRVLSFGVVTDVHYAQQYANSERYYKGLSDILKHAVNDFTEKNVDFIIELGDLIHAPGKKKDERNHLEEIDAVFSAFPKDRHYVLGNHDLQRFSKKEFLSTVDRRDGQYSFDMNGYHFIVLDACFNPDGSEYKQGRFNWTESCIPKSGLEWLTDDLTSAAGKPVIVFLHQMLHNERFRHCVLNASEVRAVLETHGNVRAVFQGHTHFNTYASIGGINYLTFSAMVSSRNRDRNAHAVVHLDADGGITIDGYAQRSYTWE